MKKISLIFLAAVLLLAFAGCGRPLHILWIEGDCEGLAISDSFHMEFGLGDTIALAQPRAEEFDLLLMGGDGLVARIPGDDLSGCTLAYSKEYAWELRSESHPPSANIKNLAQIAVVSTSEDSHAVRFVNGGEVRSLTAGQLLLHDNLRVLREEGTSHKNGRSVTVYTTHWRVPLGELCPEGEQFRAAGFDGETVYFSGTENCFLESAGNQINLLLADGQTIKDLASVEME